MNLKPFALVVFFISGLLNAQVTISFQDFPFVQETIYQPADTNGIMQLLHVGKGGHFDFANLKSKGGLQVVKYENGAQHPFFIASTERSLQKVPFGPLWVNRLTYYGKNASGYIAEGIEYERQKYGLGFISGDNTDSITFPEQRAKFPFVYREIQLPLAWKTNWAMKTPNKIRTDFVLDISSASYTNTPCYIVHAYTKKDTVISYGTCDIPAKQGTGSVTYSTLVLRSEIIRVDSFYINNQPANNFLLGALGLNQSDTVRTYMYRFIRPGGGMYSLANIYFTDGTYTKVLGAEYSTQLLRLGTENISAESAEIYPNPYNQGPFTVKLQGHDETVVFLLYDVTGKQVLLKAEKMDANTYQLTPANKMSGGIYTLQLATKTKTTFARLVVQ